jgi:ketosteroid isomerase-like protein
MPQSQEDPERAQEGQVRWGRDNDRRLFEAIRNLEKRSPNFDIVSDIFQRFGDNLYAQASIDISRDS